MKFGAGDLYVGRFSCRWVQRFTLSAPDPAVLVAYAEHVSLRFFALFIRSCGHGDATNGDI